MTVRIDVVTIFPELFDGVVISGEVGLHKPQPEIYMLACERLEVEPTDLFVTEPIEGKNIITLQTCTLPDYAQRVIVQAELQDTQA